MTRVLRRAVVLACASSRSAVAFRAVAVLRLQRRLEEILTNMEGEEE